MPEKEGFYKQRRLYELVVKIKGLDYTNELVSLELVSSLSTAYPIVNLVFSIDPNDVLAESIFGGEPIKVSIILYRESSFPGPKVDLELMYLKSDFLLTEKSDMTEAGPQVIKDRTPLIITTVVRKPYKIMTSLVNDVFIGTNLRSIITSLASDVGATLKMDSDNENKTSIDQVCIPPTTFYKVIKEYNRTDPDMFDGFLDQRFGLFEGTPGVFCQYDGTVYIKNLTSKLQKNQTFTVYQLASGIKDKKLKQLFKDSLKGDTFYTYDLVTTDYSGNAKFGVLATDINHLVRPNKSISATIAQDLEDVAKQYSLFYSKKNTSLYINKSTYRKKYYNEDTGYDIETTLFRSRFGRLLSDLSSVSLNLERNLPILNLINVGECVKFKPQTLEYNDLEGKYILWSSHLNFSRTAAIWETTATINLARTNKKN